MEKKGVKFDRKKRDVIIELSLCADYCRDLAFA